MRFFVVMIFAVIPLSTVCAAESDTTIAPQPPPKNSRTQFDLSARLANESNWADGLLGPITYGLIGDIIGESGLELNATFIRMHEPGMATFNSVLDEAQLSIKYPLSDPLTIDATLWKNRMMDIYTTLGGIEGEYAVDHLGVGLGLYAGEASRFEATGRFIGAGIEVSTAIGNLELALSHVAGLIHTPTDPTGLGTGKYHKSGLEATTSIHPGSDLPLRTTLSVERRYFDFGGGAPASDPIDTYIVVAGLEVGISSIF